MKALGVTAERDRHQAGREADAGRHRPSVRARARTVYDVTFENVQAGLRTDYLFRLANQHRGMVVGTGDLSELGARLVHLRRRRSHVPLQRERLGVEDADPAPDPLGRGVGRRRQEHRRHPARHPRHRDLARADPGRATARSQATESFVGPYALQDFNLFYLTRFGFRPSKIAFLAWNAWHDAKQGRVAGERARPARSAPIDWRRSSAGWSCSCGASSATSSSARRCPTDRRSRRAARCRRAAIGVRPRTAAPTSGWQS